MKNAPKETTLVSHYTTLKAFPEFMKKDAWFYGTHDEFLNDPSEKIYALNLFDQYLRKSDFHYLSGKIKIPFTLFITSFTNEHDNINQWRAYTSPDEGGFSIQFNENVIENTKNWSKKEPFEDTWKYGLQHRLNFGWGTIDKVRYGESEAEGLFNDYMTRAVEKINIDNKVYGNYKNEMEIYWLNYYRVLFAGFVKNESYKDEKEYRISFSTSNEEGIEMIGGKPRRKALKIDHKKMISSITVSPHGNYKRNKRLAEVLCENIGLPKGTVKLSKIQYRNE